MLKHAVAGLAMLAGTACAEVAQVPLLPNGDVDLEAALLTYRATRDLYENGPGLRIEGSFLGKPFVATFAEDQLGQDMLLEISAPDLTEHGVAIVASLTNDILCRDQGLYADHSQWRTSSARIGDIWQVVIECRETPIDSK